MSNSAVLLKDVVLKIKGGGTPSVANQNNYLGELPFAKIDDITSATKYLEETKNHISTNALTNSSAWLVPSKSILYSIYATLGEVAILRKAMTTNQAILGIVPDGNKIDTEYLYYILLSFKKDISRLAKQGTQKNLTKAIVENLEIKLPSIKEQKKIATILSEVDNSLEATDNIITHTHKLKRAYMQEVFDLKNLTGLPLGWQVRRLDEVASVQTGIAKNASRDMGDSAELPYLRVANVQDGRLDLSEIKTIKIRESDVARFSLQKGDLLLTEGGDHDKLGRGFIWDGGIQPCLHQNHVFAVRSHKQLLSRYLAYITQSPYGKKYFLSVAIRTTNLASINSTKLKQFPVLLPPLDEQRRIVEVLSVLDEKISFNESIRFKQQGLRLGLMQELLNGKVQL